MEYITLNDLNRTIRANLWKFPHDIDIIIGIPRSGMIAASIIAEYLNKPLCTLEDFIDGRINEHGLRKIQSNGSIERALVIDDTCFNGTSMAKAKQKLQGFKNISFIYGVIYLEGNNGKNVIDIFLEDIRYKTSLDFGIVLYEWNIFHHDADLTSKFIFDMDGILCLDPPDERCKELYDNYIQNAIPLIIPTHKIGAICTYRLDINRAKTEKWLNDKGIKYNDLIMTDAESWDERAKKYPSSAIYKGEYYKSQKWSILFFESDAIQAKQIANYSGKPVFSYSENKIIMQ